MRAAGSTLGRLRDSAPSPVWPEGREVFLFRPLLDVRRAELRALLRGRGLDWIDDPANADPRSLRARVRRGAGAVRDACRTAGVPSFARSGLSVGVEERGGTPAVRQPRPPRRPRLSP